MPPSESVLPGTGAAIPDGASGGDDASAATFPSTAAVAGGGENPNGGLAEALLRVQTYTHIRALDHKTQHRIEYLAALQRSAVTMERNYEKGAQRIEAFVRKAEEMVAENNRQLEQDHKKLAIEAKELIEVIFREAEEYQKGQDALAAKLLTRIHGFGGCEPGTEFFGDAAAAAAAAANGGGLVQFGSAASNHIMTVAHQAFWYEHETRRMAFQHIAEVSAQYVDSERKLAETIVKNNAREAQKIAEDRQRVAEHRQQLAEARQVLPEAMVAFYEKLLAEMAEHMAECRQVQAENNRRLEKEWKIAAILLKKEMERGKQLSTEYAKKTVDCTVRMLVEARFVADIIHGYETGGGAETVKEAAALRREVLEAELARTRLEEKKKMEE